MRFLRSLAPLALIATASVAHAAVTGTFTGTTDYDFRGLSQSAHDPALQGGIDWASNDGWYLGVWGSKIDLGGGAPNLEVDLYGGFRQTLSSGVGYDLGSVYYNYHAPGGHDLDYLEVYAGTSYRWVAAKLYFSPKFGGNAGSDMMGGGGVSAFYFTTDAIYPLPARFSLTGHAGYSFGDYWDKAHDLGFGRPYFDWAAGVGYAYRHFSLALRWVDGSDLRENESTSHAILSTKARAVFSVTTTLPWNSSW